MNNSSGFNVYIDTIVSDDDNTMRAHLQHASEKGKLLDRIPTPHLTLHTIVTVSM